MDTARFKFYALILILCFTAGCRTAPVRVPETEQTKTIKEEIPARPLPVEALHGLISEGKYDRAIDLLDRSLESDTVDPDSRILRARLLILDGRYDDARSQIQEILTDGDNVEALYQLAVLERAEENRTAQNETLNRVLEMQPDHVPALTAMGEAFFEKDEIDSAEPLFSQVLEIDRDCFQAVIGLGRVRHRQGKLTSAEELLRRAIELQPAYSFTYSDLSKVFKTGGRYQEAVETISLAVDLDPRYYWNYIDRAKLQLLLGDTAAGEKDLLQAIKTDGEHFLPYVYLGLIYFESERWEEASDYLLEAVRRRPDYHHAYLPLGIASYAYERWSRAVGSFRKAYEFFPEEHTLILAAALCARKAGDSEGAVRLINGNFGHFPEKSWYRDIAQFLIEPDYDAVLLQRLRTEKQRIVRGKIAFFLASEYLTNGKTRTAQALLLEYSDLKPVDLMESVLIRWELKKMGDEGETE